jgi:hypothetical protein
MVDTPKNIGDNKVVDTIETPEVIVRLRGDGIVHATFKKDAVFDIAMQLKMLEINTKITGGKKSYFIYDAEENVTITKEARDNATKIEHLAPVKGSVVVANNLAYRIIANFYIQFNKPATPFKVVRSLEEGLKWLKNLPA